MAQRTGTQLRSDLAAIESAVDAAIAAPNTTTAAAVTSACDTAMANARDSIRSVQETATQGVGSHAVAGRYPAAEIRELVDQIRKDTLHLVSKGAVTDAKSWKSLKRTNISAVAWQQFARAGFRATVD